jgi:TolA-binding protein
LLSESVRGLMEKLKALKRELEQLEGRLECSEIQEFTLQESLRRERERAESEKERAERESERADALRAELDAQRRDQSGGEQRSPWRKLFGKLTSGGDACRANAGSGERWNTRGGRSGGPLLPKATPRP